MSSNKLDQKGSVNLYRPFLYFLVIISIVSVLYLLQDFLTEIVIAGMLAVFSFPLYRSLTSLLANKKSLSALIMTLLFFTIILLPIIQLTIYGAREASAWTQTGQSILSNINQIEDQIFSVLKISPESQPSIRQAIASILETSGDYLLNIASNFLKNISSFFLAIFIFLFSYFYFLLHGRKLRDTFLRFSPLARKYNLDLVASFKNISQNTVWSIGVSAVIQGLLSALSLLLIGWPFMIAFVVSFTLSIVPYLLIFLYLPIAIYLFSLGQIWTALFILAWNLLLVANLDKLIRAYVVKGKTKVNMIFMLFAILGGISLFGLAGVFIGPLIATLALKVIDIYGEVFSHKLEK
ncbi:MAG: AI-2E family transporter [Clostridia bacterium]|nr:AI-2E family transporter [Clostridia bacterium]